VEDEVLIIIAIQFELLCLALKGKTILVGDEMHEAIG